MSIKTKFFDSLICQILMFKISATTENAANQSTVTDSTSFSFTTTPHRVPGNVSLTVIEFRSLDKIIPEYSDSKSQAFQDRAKHVKDKVS